MIKKLFYIILFILLTLITQVGGVALLLGLMLSKSVTFRFNKLVFVLVVYLVLTFGVVPYVAPIFGRERVRNADKVKPTSYMTVLLNRNYVKPELNDLLSAVALHLPNGMELRYLDANLPFIDGFPLLPHLSHNDGKKIDLSFVYHKPDGSLTNEKPSRSGYGVFENPTEEEFSQTEYCFKEGYWQYDYSKYFTFGIVHEDLRFSKMGTSALLLSILKESRTGKVFLERHLKERLGVEDSRVRFQGCRSVRHDDHIHIQLK